MSNNEKLGLVILLLGIYYIGVIGWINDAKTHQKIDRVWVECLGEVQEEAENAQSN